MKNRIYLLLILGLIFLRATDSARAESSKVLTSVSVETNPVSPFASRWADLVAIKQGDNIDETWLQNRLKELSETGLFERADYEMIPQGRSGYELKIHLIEAPIIHDVIIKNNYPFLDKDIRRLVSMLPGSTLKNDRLLESLETIQQYLAKNGFPENTVSFEQRETNYPGQIDLIFKITKGQSYRLGKVTFEGVTALNPKRLQSKLSHFSRFSLSRLRADLQKIKKIYHKKGYLRVRVKLAEISIENKKTNLKISIHEGKKLITHFKGNPLARKSKLENVLGFLNTKSFDTYSINNSITRLKSYYSRRGYPYSIVTVDINKSNPDIVELTYNIIPGKRVELSKIDFSGNENIGDKKLKKTIKSNQSSMFKKGIFQEKRLLSDRQILKEFYIARGYLDAEINDIELSSNSLGDHKYVIFPIHEGSPYLMGTIAITTDAPIDVDLLLNKMNLKSGKVAEQEKLNKAIDKIRTELQEEGYAYSTVELEATPDTNNRQLNLNFIVHRGPLVHLRKIVFQGDVDTKNKILQRNLTIKEGSPFVYQKILDSQLNLKKLGIFDTVRIKPMGFEEKSDQIDLLIMLHESKSVEVTIQAGFDTTNSASGELSFIKKNLFGSAKQFQVRAIGGKKYDRGEMTFYAPRIFGVSWNLSNQYFFQYEDNRNFDAVSAGAYINTLKNFGPHLSLSLRDQIIRTNIFESKSNASLAGSLFDNTLNELRLQVTFDFRDNFSDPQKGFLAIASNELSTDLTDLHNHFDTAEFSIAHFQGFLKRFTLINSFRYSQIFTVGGTPQIPVNKLFFLGGSDTLRGFSQDAVNTTGGTLALVYNSELHFKIADGFKLAGFFDVGALENNLDTLHWNDFRESAGVGLRYFTPIGPLRLDLGFVLDRRINEPKQRLHFSFGFFF